MKIITALILLTIFLGCGDKTDKVTQKKEQDYAILYQQGFDKGLTKKYGHKYFIRDFITRDSLLYFYYKDAGEPKISFTQFENSDAITDESSITLNTGLEPDKLKIVLIEQFGIYKGLHQDL